METYSAVEAYIRRRYSEGFVLSVDNEELDLAGAIKHASTRWLFRGQGIEGLHFDKTGNR